jgi:hypothetical protein
MVNIPFPLDPLGPLGADTAYLTQALRALLDGIEHRRAIRP